MKHPAGHCAQCGEPESPALGCPNCDQLAAMGVTTEDEGR